MSDVLDYMEQELRGTSLTANSPYEVDFLGVPVEQTDGGESGRDNLGDASNVNAIQSGPEEVEPDKSAFTIVGGLMVGALVCAFLGILVVLWRRRRAWLRQRQALEDDEIHLDLNKGTHPSDDYDYDYEGEGDDEDHSPHSEEGGFPNKFAFDMGNSFKDQLMGVHGTGGRPPVSNISRPAYGSSGGSAYAMTPVGRDAMSDSDADSWAQTDGTIGSLELQLEPITAEV